MRFRMQDCDRDQLEARSGAKALAIPIEPRVALCRVLEDILLYVDPTDCSVAPHLMVRGCWEPWVTVAVAGLVKPGMSVVNLGAHVGYFAALFADLVGPNGDVVAVEPQARLVDLIERTADANGFGQLSVRQIAVSDVAGAGWLSVNSRNDGWASLSKQPTSVSVLTDTLAGLVRDRKVDLLFMDIEGAERLVLPDVKTLLKTSPNVSVVMEWNPKFADAKLAEDIGWLGGTLCVVNGKGRWDHITVDALAAMTTVETIGVLR